MTKIQLHPQLYRISERYREWLANLDVGDKVLRVLDPATCKYGPRETRISGITGDMMCTKLGPRKYPRLTGFSPSYSSQYKICDSQLLPPDLPDLLWELECLATLGVTE